MRDRLKPILELMLTSIVFWSVVMCFFVWIRYYDLDGEPGIQLVNDFIPSFWELTLIGIYIGFIIGFFYALLDLVFDHYLSVRLHMGLILFIKTLSYLFLLIFSVTAVMSFVEILWGMDLPNERGWWRETPNFWVFVAYFGIFSLIFSFLKIAQRRFGRGVLLNLLMGSYTKPKEEDRIFLFLDLRSSTSIAEKLGHLLYSSFIRDCFLDLNKILDKYEAEVYQYVGDEAVISWKYDRGLRRDNCVRLFFHFENILRKRYAHYSEKYGIEPEFKAGLHGGTLVVVEVGSIRKELAYHGDVMNTSARIQEQCNKYGENLLVSASLLRDMKLNQDFITKEIGLFNLRGKSDDQLLFAIRQPKKNP
ncbi:MAG: adenylate/guanylate cyclase domain-containing protein [Flavobacteriaceae bacterium]